MMYYLHQHFVPNGTPDVAADTFFTNIQPLTGHFPEVFTKNKMRLPCVVKINHTLVVKINHTTARKHHVILQHQTDQKKQDNGSEKRNTR